MALFSQRSMDDWIAEYADAHQHPINRIMHSIGIPMIALSVVLAPLLFIWPVFAVVASVLFVVGWLLQFIGHAFEGKPPEFLKDWRFLFVGLRWWLAKIRGKI